MKNCYRLVCALGLAIGAIISVIPNAHAFTYTNQNLQMMLCFRQLGTANPYDLEVNIGSVTNLIALPIGTTITNTNFTYIQLSNAMASGTFENAEFSVTASAYVSNTTQLAVTSDTVWATIPRSDPVTPNVPWTRENKAVLATVASSIYSIGSLAAEYSGIHVSDPLVNSGPVVGIPPNNAYSCEGYLGLNGDLNGDYFQIENLAPLPFASAIVSDFFMEVPEFFADPLNANATSGLTDYLGYFTFSPAGSLTFTRAAISTYTPPPQPTLNMTRSGTTSTISFGTTNAATYNLIFTNLSELKAPRNTWPLLGSPITGTGGNTNFTDTTTDTNRIYSVTAH